MSLVVVAMKKQEVGAQVKVINILSKNPAGQGKIENKVKNIENIEDGLLVVTYPSND